MKIGDKVFVHGYVDEIRKDIIIIRNEGGYFGTVPDEILPSAQPDQDREFIKLTVRNSNGRPYYSIIYLEVDDNGVGRDFEGYSSYSLDVISDYLKKYFMPSALPETCEGCKHLGKWENEFEYGYPSPCTRCKRRVEDHYER